MEAEDGQLPPALIMHQSLLPADISPRKICIHAAAAISQLLRLYKRNYGLRRICDIAVYIAHSACTIHLLTLPEESARVNIIQGVRHLEDIAESWLCARRALHILNVLARQWKVALPEEAADVLNRADAELGFINPQGPKSLMTASFRSSSGVMTLPLNIIAGLNNSAHSQDFSIHQIQRKLWEQDQVLRSVTRQARTFPYVLFNSISSPAEESQGWLRNGPVSAGDG
ncbi:MAG: hypothetical protein Q9187_003263 [Circinaria calcarea]